MKSWHLRFLRRPYLRRRRLLLLLLLLRPLRLLTRRAEKLKINKKNNLNWNDVPTNSAPGKFGHIVQIELVA